MATTSEPVVRVEGLRKVYALGESQVVALAGIDLEIRAGEFVAVMGPSGSGKSTFMQITGLLDNPTAGHYYFEGTDVSHLDADARADIRSRRLGFVFQSYNLLPRTSALENVELPMVYAGVPAAERIAIAHEKMRIVGVDHLAEHHPNQMSGGQQQRVAIARSLVNNPGLILADEPDRRARYQNERRRDAHLQRTQRASRHYDHARHPRTRYRRARETHCDVPRRQRRFGYPSTQLRVDRVEAVA